MVAVMSTARSVDGRVVVVVVEEDGLGERWSVAHQEGLTFQSKIGRDGQQSRKRLVITSVYDVTCLQMQTQATTQSILGILPGLLYFR
jgi:hypothetical protein